MDLIRISNDYFIDIEKYEKLKIGDIFTKKPNLLREICYPTIGKVNTTHDRLFNIIDKIIGYEKVGGYKIRITSITPTAKAKEIIEDIINKTKQREKYKTERDFLLDYIILPCEDNPVYITSYELIKAFNIFPQFYYDYCDIRYDTFKPSLEETLKLQSFASIHSLPEKYLIDIMEILSGNVYEKFNNDIISNWAKRNGITAERVLFRGGELDYIESNDIEQNYYQPLKDKGVPAKSRTKLANEQFMKDKNIQPLYYRRFYRIFKFTKPDNEQIIVNCSETELEQIQKSINEKFVKQLESKAIDPKGEHYHKDNAKYLEYIIGNLKL